ncbi:hypothetical protein EZI54_04735 [Marinobacter halodurans]|uniref:Phenol degradation protein meta n=1 Tax=Marinobacter halodurans TaxID=2528979 RepID=A0ABY1ZNN6_9GAMM|nr:transporter [Marinobacter halodurans]TBW58164.1 hypothetical protein EZI54_04735 [Marinobacter halodurans]
MKINKKALAPALLATTLAYSTASIATENGAPTTAFGLFDFGSGYLPPTTDHGTVGFRTAYYTTDQQKDGNGDDTGNDVSLDVLSLSLAYLYMTDKTILGARYGVGAVVPFFNMDAQLKVKAGGMTVFEDDADVFALADVQVLPALLQWTPNPNLSIVALFQVQAPTGDYDENRLVSPGLNHWAFTPQAAFTYVSDGGYEISSSFQLDINTRNKDTDYRNGTEYRQEFALGKHVGPWTIGIGGYHYRQITDDDAPGLVDGNRAAVAAVGPAIGFFAPGSSLPPFRFHVYKEFGAKNRTEGYNMALTTSYSF